MKLQAFLTKLFEGEPDEATETETVGKPIESPQSQKEMPDEASMKQVLGKDKVMPKKEQMKVTGQYNQVLNAIKKREDDQTIANKVELFKSELEKIKDHPNKKKLINNVDLLSGDFLDMEKDFYARYNQATTDEDRVKTIDGFLNNIDYIEKKLK